MRIVATLLLAPLSMGGYAEDYKSVPQQAAEATIEQLSGAVVDQAFQNSNTPLGQAISKQKRDSEMRAIRSAPQVKSARECAKPGNLIDEDVMRCMKGL